MIESFLRGFRMIWASLKMGWQDKRLLLPSVLIVFCNCLFGAIFFLDGIKQLTKQAGGVMRPGQQGGLITGGALPSHGLFDGHPTAGSMGNQGSIGSMLSMSGTDPNSLQFNWETLSGLFTTDNLIIVSCLMAIWWLTNRFLEGVTTALVYSHLTEGRGTGKFSEACAAVFQSLPAILVLGLVTLIAKKIASWLRNRHHGGLFGAGFNMLAGVVEVFWTLAGHLILPAIVIEGCSFWGGLKRADKIAQGSLLTIGVGEVGVELICRASTWLVYLTGGSALGAGLYLQINLLSAPVLVGGLCWAACLVLVTALSIYIRSAFYTCLYVWALEAEAVEETERVKIKAPAPLAAALA